MTENGVRRLRSVYGICLSALTVVVGALFIMQVWSIFFSAEQDPYTVEIVAEKFWQISVPVFLWVAALIGGGVLALVFPDKKERLKADVSSKTSLERLQRRIVGEGKDLPEAQKQEDMRFIVKCIAALICAACAVLSLMILFGVGPLIPLGGEFFSTHVEAVRLISILPWVVVMLAVITAASYLLERSYAKETKALKDAIATKRVEMGKPTNAEKTLKKSVCEEVRKKPKHVENAELKEKLMELIGERGKEDVVEIVACNKAFAAAIYRILKEINVNSKTFYLDSEKKPIKYGEYKAKNKPAPKDKNSFLRSPKFLLGLRIGLYVVGILFVVVGIFNGGMADVLMKAINICTQCIGLG